MSFDYYTISNSGSGCRSTGKRWAKRTLHHSINLAAPCLSAALRSCNVPWPRLGVGFAALLCYMATFGWRFCRYATLHGHVRVSVLPLCYVAWPRLAGPVAAM